MINYTITEDIDEIIKMMRFDPLNNEKIMVELSNDICIECNIRRAFVNILLFKLLDEYNITKDKNRINFIFDGTFDKGKPIEFLNKVIDTIEIYYPKFKEEPPLFNRFLTDINMIFQYTVLVVNQILVMEHTLFDYIRAYNNNNEFKNILDKPIFDEKDSPFEIQSKLDNTCKKIGEMNMQPISHYLKSGVKLKLAQLQMLFAWGHVPDYLDYTRVLPPIKHGVLNGFKSKLAVLTGANILRMVNRASKNEVKKSGTSGKLLDVALSNIKMNDLEDGSVVDDCHSIRYESYNIKSEKDLRFFRFCYYVVEDSNTPKEFNHTIINSKGLKLSFINIDRNDLIGKTLKCRTIAKCDSDIICGVCAGKNNIYLKDNSVYKTSIARLISDKIAELLQLGISTKHHTGCVPKMIYVTMNNEEYTILEFMKKFDFIQKINYDEFKFNNKYNIEIQRNSDASLKVLVDNTIVIHFSCEFVEEIDKHNLKINVPAQSIMNVIRDFDLVFKKHNSKNKITNKPDFLIPDNILNIDDKLTYVQKYIMEKLNLDHIKYYEVLTRCLTRDENRKHFRVTNETSKLKFIHVNEIVSNRLYTDSYSSTMIHGYIKNNFNQLNDEEIRPDMNDLLFQNIGSRYTTDVEHMYSTFNRILADSIDESLEEALD